jgi:hypothetical protein
MKSVRVVGVHHNEREAHTMCSNLVNIGQFWGPYANSPMGVCEQGCRQAY